MLALNSLGYPNTLFYAKETMISNTGHCPNQQTSSAKTSQNCEKNAQSIFDLSDEYAVNNPNFFKCSYAVFTTILSTLFPVYPIYKPPKFS